MISKFPRFCAFILLLPCLFACGVAEIKQQSEILENASQITGQIKRTSTQTGPLKAMVFEQHDDLITLEGVLPTNEYGIYSAAVTPGSYQIVAFIDHNLDGIYQTSEHAAFNANQPFVTVKANETQTIDTLIISNDVFSHNEYDTSKEASKAYANVGKVTSMNDPLFSRKHYSNGMWKPMDFLQDIGGGLFMLEEYQPEKTPILFIHGLSGGPKDWQPLIKKLDHSRFQPWVYYYPTGIQLQFSTDFLVMAIFELQQRYQFNEIIVAAHSMGGLIARAFVKEFIHNYPSQQNLVKMLISINAPMNGMRSAADGVKHSPVVVQSWRDLAEGSDFIADLQQWHWPDHIPYHLIFSFQQNDSSDGIIPIDSQIPMRTQNESTRIYGFVNSHAGTLEDREFITLFNALVNE